jgi:hypothetical protein
MRERLSKIKGVKARMALSWGMLRRFRALAAVASMLAFLFAQTAASAYACAGPVVDPVAMAEMKAVMGSDAVLCEQHCAGPTGSFEAAKPSPVSMPVVLAPLPAAQVEILQWRAPVRAQPLSVAGPAPPLVRFTVLRI